jgi:hypothetical protein
MPKRLFYGGPAIEVLHEEYAKKGRIDYTSRMRYLTWPIEPRTRYACKTQRPVIGARFRLPQPEGPR